MTFNDIIDCLSTENHQKAILSSSELFCFLCAARTGRSSELHRASRNVLGITIRQLETLLSVVKWGDVAGMLIADLQLCCLSVTNSNQKQRQSVTDKSFYWGLWIHCPYCKIDAYNPAILSDFPLNPERCRRPTLRSWRSSWTRGFTSGSMAGVRFAPLADKSQSKKNYC